MQVSKLERLLAELIAWPYLGFFIGLFVIAMFQWSDSYLVYSLVIGSLLGLARALGVAFDLLNGALLVINLQAFRAGLVLLYGLLFYSLFFPSYF